MKRNKKGQSIVGVEFRRDGLAVVRARVSEPGRYGLVSAQFLPCEASAWNKTLEDWVEANNEKKSPCFVVLNPDQYSLMQVEKPEVPAADLADALRWRVKDLLDFPADQAALDLFDMPADTARRRGQLINVVASRRSTVKDIIKAVDEAGLKLKKIDIAELAIRNLVSALDTGPASVGLLYFRNGLGVMTLNREQHLYLSRRLEMDINALKDEQRQQVMVEHAALEVQRSLDYFESQLGQAPVAKLFLAPLAVEGDTLERQFALNLAARMENLDLTQVVDMPEDDGPDALEQQQCLLALGAVMQLEAA